MPIKVKHELLEYHWSVFQLKHEIVLCRNSVEGYDVLVQIDMYFRVYRHSYEHETN